MLNEWGVARLGTRGIVAATGSVGTWSSGTARTRSGGLVPLDPVVEQEAEQHHDTQGEESRDPPEAPPLIQRQGVPPARKELKTFPATCAPMSMPTP